MFSREASLGFAAEPWCTLAADSLCIASQNLNDCSNDIVKYAFFFLFNDWEVFHSLFVRTVKCQELCLLTVPHQMIQGT